MNNTKDWDNTSAQSLAKEAERILASLLPDEWRMTWSPSSLPERSRVGRQLEIASPDGTIGKFEVELIGRFEPRDAYSASATLKYVAPQRNPLVIAPYLSRRSRELLQVERVSYLDFTGNAHIVASHPAILIDRQGSDKDPQPRIAKRSSLVGPITGRVVRFLCEHRPPYGVREIASKTNVDAGAVSRILDFAERSSLIQRDEKGSVVDVHWQDLISQWSHDLAKRRIDQTYLEPRGLDTFLNRLRASKHRYALTGQFAANEYVLVAPPVVVDVYVQEIEVAADHFRFRRTDDHIGNVRLIDAFDRVVFENTERRNGLTFASPCQVAADLLTLPHRSRDEYQQLIAWMEVHQRDWQH